MLTECINVNSLELLEVQLDQEQEHMLNPTISATLLTLRHLTIANSPHWSSDLRGLFNLPYVTLSGLRSLTVYVEGLLFMCTGDLEHQLPLKYCSTSLEELRLLSRKDQLGRFSFFLLKRQNHLIIH